MAAVLVKAWAIGHFATNRIRRLWEVSINLSSHTRGIGWLDGIEDQMRTGMGAWLICSTICFMSLAYGQLALSAYFLALSCVIPPYVAKELERRRP